MGVAGLFVVFLIRFIDRNSLDLNNPDLEQYAESFGAYGISIESADELASVLRTALKANKLTVIDCLVVGLLQVPSIL